MQIIITMAAVYCLLMSASLLLLGDISNRLPASDNWVRSESLAWAALAGLLLAV